MTLPVLHIGAKRIQKKQNFFARLSLPNLPQYPSVRKTGRRYKIQGRGIGGIESVIGTT